MSLVAVIPLPYGYYQLLRVVVFTTAAFLCWREYLDYGKIVDLMVLALGTIALVFNPFLPVELPRLVWMIANLLVAFVFALHYWRLRTT